MSQHQWLTYTDAKGREWPIAPEPTCKHEWRLFREERYMETTKREFYCIFCRRVVVDTEERE